MESPILPLFELLQVALDSEHFVNTNIFDGADWLKVYMLASSQGVLPLCWDGLQRLIACGNLSSERQPDKMLRLRWCYNVEQDKLRYCKQLQALGRLATFYASHGIPMMVLKGYGLSLCYPRPDHRPYGDIDIWLYGEQRRADALLQSEKGVRISEEEHHHTTFDVGGVHVENHYDFLNVHAHWSNRAIEKRLQELARQPGETVTIDGQPINLPSADFNALFLLRHAASHFAAERIGLRHVADWAMFVRKYHEQIDWPSLERIAREQNMHRFLHCLNALSIDYLGIAPDFFPPFERDAELERRVLAEILHPEFDRPAPKGSFVKVLDYKFRRWWANRWKHRIVYREGLLPTFCMQFYAHLLKPASLGIKKHK